MSGGALLATVVAVLPPFRRALLAFALLAATALTACTSGGSTPAPSPTAAPSSRSTTAAPRPSVTPTGAVSAGPTTTARADCPFISLSDAMPHVGQRLDHSTVSTSDGQPVGCDFYPITGGLAGSERLPDPNQSVVRIRISRYRTSPDAHNALARAVEPDPDAASVPISGADAAVYYVSTLYPPDNGQDSSLAMQKGARIITVQIAQTKSEGSVTPIAQAVIAKVA